MKVNVNPDIQTTGFGYVEAGKYTVRVVKVTQLEGPNAPYLKWELELTDPNIETVDGKGKPGHVFENTTLKPEAQFRLRQCIEALGAEWGNFDTEDLIGSEMDVELGIREYQGQLSNEVKKYIPASK